jgi:hypothetical protein
MLDLGAPFALSFAVGAVVHQFLWFAHSSANQFAFSEKYCYCCEPEAVSSAVCFCVTHILFLIVSVWMIPFVFLFALVPDKNSIFQKNTTVIV